MDPVHELYLLDHNGNAVTVHEGRIVLLSGRKSPLSEFTDEEIRELAGELRENRMAQFEKTIRERIISYPAISSKQLMACCFR